jgi:hypothetical protein
MGIEGRLAEALLPADDGLAGMDAAILSRERAQVLMHGSRLPPSERPWRPSEQARLYDAAGAFVGIGAVGPSGEIRPVKVLAGAAGLAPDSAGRG